MTTYLKLGTFIIVEQKKILVVEDETFLRDIYTNTLQEEGYFVASAVDGEEALKKMKEKTWDLVLLDIRLPKLSGFDVMEKLKNDSTYKPSPTVFLTNIYDESQIKNALNSFVSGYLIKTQITPADLINEVKMYLDPSIKSKPE